MIKTKTYWKIHSILGLITGIPLLIIAFTGSVLVFKDEINQLIIPHETVSKPVEQGRLPYDTLFEKLEKELDGHVIAGWATYDLPTQADYVYIIPKGTGVWEYIYLDPYSGEILSDPRVPEAELMGWILEFHYTLLGGTWGATFVGIIALLLLLLGFTGLKIYKKFWRSLLKMRWKTSLRQLSGNLHKRIGIISAPVFIILGFTGLWWNISHVMHELEHEHEDEIIERLYIGDSISIDDIVKKSQQHIEEFNVHYIDFPREKGFPISLYGETPRDSFIQSQYSGVVTFNAQNGIKTSAVEISNATTTNKFLDAFRPLHFGTFGGLFTRIIWCILGSMPGWLALSGFYIWFKKSKRKKQSAKNKKQTSSIDSPSTQLISDTL